MPEGDTLVRTAAGLRPYLVGRPVTGARSPVLAAQAGRVIGATVTAVDTAGKNLLIHFDNGLEIRTHLRMTGSWHRYAPGERWRRPASRARLVLEVPGAVAVCFDAPVIELFDARAQRIHPVLANLGPDLLADDFDAGEALRRLRDPARADLAIGEALVDQRALAGIGNIWKSETLFAERVDPFAPVAALDDETLRRLIARAGAQLRSSVSATAGGPRRSFAVYRRAGRPCRACGAIIAARSQGSELPRLTYWCPRCQNPRDLGRRLTEASPRPSASE
jgi:endonuclease-8